ncbi:MAG: hypothetical protein ABIF92_00835 [archaeon]
MEKTLLFLDTQKREFSARIKPVYDFLVKIQQKSNFKIRILPKIKNNPSIRAVALDTKTEELLSKNNINFISKKDLTENMFELDSSKRSFEFVRALPEMLKEIEPNTVYSGMSLVDLNEKDFALHFLNPAIKTIDYCERILEKERPDAVLILNNKNFYQGLLKEVARKKHIKIIDKTGILQKAVYAIKKIGITALSRTSIPKDIRTLEGRGEAESAEKELKRRILISHDTILPKKVLPWATKIDKKENSVLYVGMTQDPFAFEWAKIPYKKLTKYSKPEIRALVKKKARELKKAHKQLVKNKEFQKKYAYHGISLMKATEELFLFMYYSRFIETITYIELMKEIISREKPGVIVTVDDRSVYGRTLVNTAKFMGIPSIIVQPGFFGDHPICGGGTAATKIAVYGETTKRYLINQGVNENQLEVVGFSDPISSLSRKKAKEQVCKELKLKKDRKIITFASQALVESMNIPIFEELYFATKQFPEIQFVIKLHPAESTSLHEEFVKKYAVKNVKIIKKIDLQELLLASDIVINLCSTVGLETLTLGLPLISLNVSGFPASFFPKDSNGIYTVKTGEELTDRIRKILKRRPDHKSIIKARRLYIRASGDAACKNIVNLIEKMIGEGEKKR